MTMVCSLLVPEREFSRHDGSMEFQMVKVRRLLAHDDPNESICDNTCDDASICVERFPWKSICDNSGVSTCDNSGVFICDNPKESIK